MAEKSSYDPGTPCWVDLGTPDSAASVRFYGELFGWEHEQAGDPERTGGYGLFTRRGKRVAGVMQTSDQPPAWTTYICVKDAEAAAARVRQAGGRVVSEPMDVIEAGRMAVFADPENAVFAIWQPRDHIGSELVDEPAAPSWNELNSRDPVAAKAFYASVFGWDARDQEIGVGGSVYTQWMLGEQLVGGMLDMRGRVPEDVPPHWMTYFTVEACEVAIEKATGLGAETLVGPVELPIGYFAVLRDPQGAHFAVFEGAAGPV